MALPNSTLADTARLALQKIRQLQADLASERERNREPIAIVGMGCRFPGGASSPEAFWSMLRDGVDSAGDIPASRWDIERYYDPLPGKAGKMYARKGCFVDDVDQFDAAFFDIVPREAHAMDPQQRLLLETSWEALEDAGIAVAGLVGSNTGVFIGLMNTDYLKREMGRPVEELDFYAGLGNTPSIAAGRLAYVLGLNGPTFVVDTACSSSQVSLHLACQSLRNSECDLALAGGVNLQLAAISSIMECGMRMLAADGRCKTFDAAADGFVRGDGCGMLVLRRLSDAIANRERILGVVKGSAVNHDGASGGLTVPNGPAQERVIRQALERAGLVPDQVGYVEAHGTGTALGDPIEVGVLGKVFQRDVAVRAPLMLGSVKTNIGHTEGAAGVAGVMKAVLAIAHGEIPPHLHFNNPSPHIAWSRLAVVVPTAITAWPDNGADRIAGVSSFGLSGTNCHTLIGAAPPSVRQASPCERPLHLLCLSAKSAPALQQLAARYAAYLEDSAEAVADICYTANAGRSHFDHRLCVTGLDSAALSVALRRQADMAPVHHGQGKRMRQAWLFSGQGSQYPGMGRQLYDTEPVFRGHVDHCAKLLEAELDLPLTELLWGGHTGQLGQTRYTQPALFALEYALGKLWQSWGLAADVVLGHSVGEYAAACLAGVFSVDDAVRLIGARARLMHSHCAPGAMLAILAEAGVVEAMLRDFPEVDLAARNGSANLVAAGSVEAIDALEREAQRLGLLTKRLAVSHAFHSRLMEPMLDAFRDVARQVTLRAPDIEYISSMTGGIVRAELTDPEYWVGQVRQGVQFAAALATLRAEKVDACLEVGPGTTLLGLGLAQEKEQGQEQSEGQGGLWLASLKNGRGDWDQLLDSLGRLYVQGAAVDWNGYDRGYIRYRVALPTYPFQRQHYWIDPVPCASPAPAGLSQIGGDSGHSLLGQRILAPTEQIMFHSEIRLDRPDLAYLDDHEVYGQAVFPAVAYLDMILGAGGMADATKTWSVSDFAISEPLPLARDATIVLHTVLTPHGDGWDARIFSLKNDARQSADAAWGLHAAARLSQGQLPEGKIDVPALQQAMPASDPARFYSAMAQIGLRYGPAFRGLRELHLGNGEALALVELPPELAPGHGYGMHPALLDACLQTAGCAVQSHWPDYDGDSYLPTGVERFALAPAAHARLWCHARLRNPPASLDGVNQLMLDVDFADEHGQSVGTLEGVVLRRVPKASVLHGVDALYNVSWRIAAELEDWPAPAAAGWLLLVPHTELGEAVAAQLAARGQHCWLVNQGGAFERTDERHFTIDPHSAQDYQRLLQALSGQSIHGVLHLWSSETAAAQSDGEPLIDLAQLGESGWASVLHLTQALIHANLPGAPALWLATRGALAVGEPGRLPGLGHAMLWGMGRSIAREHPELRCRLLDLDPEPAPEGAEHEARAIARELLDQRAEPQIAYRNGQRYLARLTRHRGAARAPAAPLRSDASYLIAGGLRGIGLLVAEWMAGQGARHLILLGRMAPSAAVQARLQALRDKGVQLLIGQVDVGQRGALAAFLDAARAQMPPLKGVIDSVGVLGDGVVLRQTGASYRQVLEPKVAGAWNLHQLTQQDQLEHFVLFSSIAALLGSAGQSNHAAANSFLDSLAHHRRALGLAALSINWGAWSHTGVAAERNVEQQLEGSGIGMVAPQQGLAWLGQLMGSADAQVMAAPIDWGKLAPQQMGSLAAFTQELLPRATSSGADAAAAREAAMLLARLKDAAPALRHVMLRDAVREKIAHTIRLPSPEMLDPEQKFFDLGMDSLMAVELRGHLQALVGQPLRATLVFDFPTVNLLCQHILNDVLKLANAAAGAPDPLSEPPVNLASLGEEELAGRLERKLRQLKERA